MMVRTRHILIIGILVLAFNQNLKAQDFTLDLTRHKMLFLLQNIDTLINDYASYSSFYGDSTDGYQEQYQFLSLFDSDSVIVFDDINPNIISGKEDSIYEQTKPVGIYVWDASREYSSLETELSWTNKASAIERLYHQNGDLYFPVSVLKKSKGIYRDSTKSKSVSTTAKLELWIHLYDTIVCEMKIAGISKIGPLSVDWDYTLSQLKRKKVETIFSLKPAYSLLYPLKSELINSPTKSITDENPFFTNTAYISDLGLQNNIYWGHVGLNADMEFRFFWRKEHKNKTKGFSIGLGGGIYNSYFQADSYNDRFAEYDRDNDYYHRTTNVVNLSETWTIAAADIPVKYSSEKWKNYRKGRYFKFGARLSYVYGLSFANGEYSRSGYYPGYGIELQNIERYGFVNEQSIKERMVLNLNPYNIAVEMTFGRKRKTKSGNSIIYTGLNFGAYYDNFNGTSELSELFDYEIRSGDTPVSSYNGIFQQISDGRLGYVGIVFGIRKADPNEFILKKKSVNYSPEYAVYPKENFENLKVAGISSRDFEAEHIIPIERLSRKEKPQFSTYVNPKNPIPIYHKYLSERLILTREERKRIRKEDDREIQLSFVVDQKGFVRDIKLKNQQETDFGIALFILVSSSQGVWSPGNQLGIPISTKIEMTYKY